MELIQQRDQAFEERNNANQELATVSGYLEAAKADLKAAEDAKGQTKGDLDHARHESTDARRRLETAERERDEVIRERASLLAKTCLLENALEKSTEELFTRLGKVWTIVRIRGRRQDDCGKPLSDLQITRCNQLRISVADGGVVKPRRKTHNFEFDHVFDSSASNAEVCEKARPFVRTALAGRDVMILADGQTGTGKSWTMFDGKDSLSRSIAEQIFAYSKSHSLVAQEVKLEVQFEAFEVYKDGLKDLLSKNGTQTSPTAQHEDSVLQKCTVVANERTRLPVTSAAELCKMIREACRNRKVGENEKNPVSSRGHLVCSISLTRFDGRGKVSMTSRLKIVDLAGNEHIPSDKTNLNHIREVQFINDTRFSFFERFHPRPTSPRNDLTRLTEDCFSEDSRILLISNISPLEIDDSQNMWTLQTASKASTVESTSTHCWLTCSVDSKTTCIHSKAASQSDCDSWELRPAIHFNCEQPNCCYSPNRGGIEMPSWTVVHQVTYF